MQKFSIPWGDERQSFELPSSWDVIGYLEPNQVPPLDNVSKAVEASLNAPINMKRISELVSADAKVTIVIDDISQPTPVHQIMPQVIDRLAKAGIVQGAIKVVPALGLHRPMDLAEIRQRTGIQDLNPDQIENPACDDLDKMVNLATTYPNFKGQHLINQNTNNRKSCPHHLDSLYW